MTKDDQKEAQKERAEKLHRQIADLIGEENRGSSGSSSNKTVDKSSPSTPKSPRDFVNERMRDLDKSS